MYISCAHPRLIYMHIKLQHIYACIYTYTLTSISWYTVWPTEKFGRECMYFVILASYIAKWMFQKQSSNISNSKICCICTQHYGINS